MAATAQAVRASTRDRILDAAFEAVATFGLSRFTMDDVARLAGLLRDRGARGLEALAGGREGIRTELVHRTADIAVRAMVSYALTPSEDRPEDIAAELARILVSALQVRAEEDSR